MYIFDKFKGDKTVKIADFETTPQPHLRKMISRKILVAEKLAKFPHCECRNYRNLPSNFYDKKFVKATFLHYTVDFTEVLSWH